MTSQVKVEAKAERMNESCRPTFTLTVSTLALVCLVLSACGRGEESAVSHAATTAPQKAAPAVESHPRVETALVELGSEAHDLSLAGKVAYGEDHYSRVSSPLQGRVLEVRAHLGEHVQAGSVLLVLDSQEIAQAYAEYAKEDSDLQYATRAHDLAKDLYENKALAMKDLKQAENELIKARAEFRRAKRTIVVVAGSRPGIGETPRTTKNHIAIRNEESLDRDCRGAERDARAVDRWRVRPGTVHGGRPRYAAGGGGCV